MAKAKLKPLPDGDLLIKNYILQGLTNAKQAAIDAHYSPKTAEQSASRVLRSVKAQKLIQEHRAKGDKSFIWDKQKKLKELEEIIEHCKDLNEKKMINPMAAISAIKTHNEMQGDNAPTETNNTHMIKSFSEMYGD